VAARQDAGRDGRQGRGAGGPVVPLGTGGGGDGDSPDRDDSAGRVGERDGVVVSAIPVVHHTGGRQRLPGPDVLVGVRLSEARRVAGGQAARGDRGQCGGTRGPVVPLGVRRGGHGD